MKKTIVISLFCLIWFNISAHTRDYYSELRKIDTIHVNNTSYRTLSFPSMVINGEIHNCMLFITNLNNDLRIRQKINVRDKVTGKHVSEYSNEDVYRYNVFIKTDTIKALLKQVFSKEECQSLSSPNCFLRLDPLIDRYGNVCQIQFVFEYTDDDKTILAIPPEKLVSIESLLIEKLKIDYNDDKQEVNPSEHRMKMKEFIYGKCIFDYLRTYLYVSFNGDDLVVVNCDSRK